MAGSSPLICCAFGNSSKGEKEKLGIRLSFFCLIALLVAINWDCQDKTMGPGELEHSSFSLLSFSAQSSHSLAGVYHSRKSNRDIMMI